MHRVTDFERRTFATLVNLRRTCPPLEPNLYASYMTPIDE